MARAVEQQRGPGIGPSRLTGKETQSPTGLVCQKPARQKPRETVRLAFAGYRPLLWQVLLVRAWWERRFRHLDDRLHRGQESVPRFLAFDHFGVSFHALVSDYTCFIPGVRLGWAFCEPLELSGRASLRCFHLDGLSRHYNGSRV